MNENSILRKNETDKVDRYIFFAYTKTNDLKQKL